MLLSSRQSKDQRASKFTDECVCVCFTYKHYFDSLDRDGEVSRGTLTPSDHEVSHIFVSQEFLSRAATGVLLKPPAHTHTHTHTEDMMLSLIWCKPHTHTYSPSHITAYCTSFILNKFVFLVHKHKKDEPRVKSVCCWTLFHHSHIPGLYYQKVRNHLIKYMFSLILMLIY